MRRLVSSRFALLGVRAHAHVERGGGANHREQRAKVGSHPLLLSCPIRQSGRAGRLAGSGRGNDAALLLWESGVGGWGGEAGGRGVTAVRASSAL